MKKYNAAKRVINILKHASSLPEDQSILSVWCVVFQIPKDFDNRKRVSETHEHMNILHQQIDKIRDMMSKENFSSSLYEPYLVAIGDATTIINMGQGWGSSKQILQRDGGRVIYALEWCSEIMPEEKEVDINLLNQQLNELVDVIQDSKLPDGIIVLLNKYIDVIRRAVKAYPISGTQAMTDAVDQIIPAVYRAPKGEKNIPEVLQEKIRSIWRYICSFEEDTKDRLDILENRLLSSSEET